MLRVSHFNREMGITIVELAVVVFVIALFSAILISDFPRIQRQYALSNVTYKLSQDLRKTEDMTLSGASITDSLGQVIRAKGYGIYIDLTQSTTKYLIYADLDDGIASHNQVYNGDFLTQLCSASPPPAADCVLEIIDVSKVNPSLYIQLVDQNGNSYDSPTSIDFIPPNPTVKISPSNSEVGIVFGLNTGGSTRTVLINNSGLIKVQ